MELIEYTKESADRIYCNAPLEDYRKVEKISPYSFLKSILFIRSDMQKLEYDYISLSRDGKTEEANKMLLDLELRYPGLLSIRIDCEV